MGRETGFTLVELMVSVAVIGILAASAVPAYNAYLKRAQLTAAEVSLQTALNDFSVRHGYSPATGMLSALVGDGVLKKIPNDPWTTAVKPVTGAEEAKDWFYANDGKELVLYPRSHPDEVFKLTSFGEPPIKQGAPASGPVDLAGVSGPAILDLTPGQIAQLTPEQIAMMSAADFAQLTPLQKAALTKAQLAERAIAEKIRAMNETQYPTIDPQFVKYLTPEQIAGIQNDWWRGQFMGKRGRFLDKQQLMNALAINAAKLAPTLWMLDKKQLSGLPDAYFLSTKGGLPIATLLQKRPDLLAKIAPEQWSSINNSYWIGKMVGQYGNQLSQAQLQALGPAGVGPAAGALDPVRLDWLTPAQQAAISGHAVVQVLQKQPSWIGSMTPQQIASIGNEPRAGWWYAQIPASVAQSMSKAQIMAIPRNHCPSIKPRLSAAQQAWCQ
ncbi:MAG: prepilin-type N-terminal cleavage/methylation domain-containing protein [Mariprofundaceae bacterium]